MRRLQSLLPIMLIQANMFSSVRVWKNFLGIFNRLVMEKGVAFFAEIIHPDDVASNH